MSFNFQEYQEQAVKSLRPETTLEMLALHLVEKVGAIAGIKYKSLKVGADAEMIEIWLTEELGWCLWCVAAIAHLSKVSPSGLSAAKMPKDFYINELISKTANLQDSVFNKFKITRGRLTEILRTIDAIAEHHNLDMSAIASINLAKLR